MPYICRSLCLITVVMYVLLMTTVLYSLSYHTHLATVVLAGVRGENCEEGIVGLIPNGSKGLTRNGFMSTEWQSPHTLGGSTQSHQPYQIR